MTTKDDNNPSGHDAGRAGLQDLLQVFHGVNEALFVHDSKGGILELNERAMRMFGVDRNRALDLDFGRDFFAPHAPMRKLSRLCSRIDAGGNLLFSSTARIPGEGRQFSVEVYMKKIAWRGREAVLTTLRDITRHKEYESRLRIRRKQLEAILDAVPIATFVIDHEHKVVIWNKACEAFTGVLRDKTLGRAVDSRIFYPGPGRQVLADLVLEGNVEKMCTLYGDKNLAPCLYIPDAYEARDTLNIQGEARDIYFLAAPYQDVQGRVLGAIETIQDVSDRTRVERALKSSERRLREITSNIPGVVYQYYVQDRDTKMFTFISDGVRWMFGLDPYKVLEDQELFFQSMDEDIRATFLQALESGGESDELQEFIFSMPGGPDGEKVWIKNRALCRVREEDGAVVWNGVLTDITQEKRLEIMRSEVERIVRHDMKSPLIGIAGLGRHLLKEDLSEKQRNFVVTIYQSGIKLLRMLNNTMSLLRIEQGTYTLKEERVNLAEVFCSLHEELLPSAENKGVKLEYYLNGAAMTRSDSVETKGERILLESLFANLLHNALEASPTGESVQVVIKRSKDSCLVDIHNQGAVPANIRDRFFDRYVTHGKQYGTGLGTYSALLIARAHGGDITFTTSEEEGTHLFVTLPIPY
ncbi:PAS domain-containing sensor histidine kinase [Desulfonatronospira sp. MSAO_Bac3]|uniref:sensor histidine kinase n=1 Tax=Desulfonatronospira sp. MSAO_Bac3 TaxID=2293857 RepID=UPI000FF5B568|nr:PAS domain-containing sensor histidine kinase [Desulfonatronospira sp. MSAO_Bac3]RQD78518.1 MAG: PAS domain-containing sensor histidine kinase [Desulfonatronospira sp. MSAO_Bac3]